MDAQIIGGRPGGARSGRAAKGSGLNFEGSVGACSSAKFSCPGPGLCQLTMVIQNGHSKWSFE